MKVRINDDEYRMIGQTILEIVNGQIPHGYSLESAVLWEWYEAETSKFTFPKTRQQKLSHSRWIALVRIIKLMPDTWENDPYWQTIKMELLARLEQASIPHSRTLHV